MQSDGGCAIGDDWFLHAEQRSMTFGIEDEDILAICASREASKRSSNNVRGIGGMGYEYGGVRQ